MDMGLPISLGTGLGLFFLLAPRNAFIRGRSDKHEMVSYLQRERRTTWHRLEDRLRRSQSGWSVARYITVAFFLGLLCYLLSSQLLQSWLLGLPMLLAGILFTERLVMLWGAKRKDRFEAGNVKAIRLMASSLRTSPSSLHAFEQVAKSPYMDELVTEEYSRIVEHLRAKVPLEHVMQAFYERTGSVDAKYLATIIHIQREMGGDMAKTLDLAAATILRRRQSLRRQKAALAQIVAQVNLLSLMPFVFITALYMNNPHHFDPLTATVEGRFLMLACLSSILIGGEAIRFVAQKSVHGGG